MYNRLYTVCLCAAQVFETLPDELQAIEDLIHEYQSQADMCELRNADDVSSKLLYMQNYELL